jgi:hypothetical protein
VAPLLVEEAFVSYRQENENTVEKKLEKEKNPMARMTRKGIFKKAASNYLSTKMRFTPCGGASSTSPMWAAVMFSF